MQKGSTSGYSRIGTKPPTKPRRPSKFYRKLEEVKEQCDKDIEEVKMAIGLTGLTNAGAWMKNKTKIEEQEFEIKALQRQVGSLREQVELLQKNEQITNTLVISVRTELRALKVLEELFAEEMRGLLSTKEAKTPNNSREPSPESSPESEYAPLFPEKKELDAIVEESLDTPGDSPPTPKYIRSDSPLHHNGECWFCNTEKCTCFDKDKVVVRGDKIVS
jgi:hypothetical protein